MRKDRLNNILSKNVFDNGIVPVDYLNAYYENAHLSGASSKFLFASTECNFTTASIAKAVSDIDKLHIYNNWREQQGYFCIRVSLS